MKTKITPMQWLLILCCSISWAGIMNTGWLATSYYSLVQGALGLSDNTLGTIISLMGVAGICGYIFAGPLIDKIGSKISITIGIITVSAVTLILLFSPAPDSIAVVCCVAMRFFGCFYTTATMRYVAAITEIGAQGRSLGYFYAFMGGVSLLQGTIVSNIINSSSASSGLNALLAISITEMIICLLIIIFGDKRNPFLPSKAPAAAAESTKTEEPPFLQTLGVALKSRRLWFLGVVSFTTVCVQTLVTYVQPLFTSQFGVSTGNATLIATWVNQGTLLVFGAITGILVDKLGSTSRVIALSLVSFLVSCILVLVSPWSPSYVAIPIIGLFLIRICDSITKPGRQSMISEVGLPDNFRGCVVAFVNLVMAIPPIILGRLFDSILTRYAGVDTGYRIIYVIFIGIAIIGFLGLWGFVRSKKEAA